MSGVMIKFFIFALLAVAFAEEAAQTNETDQAGGTKDAIGKGYGNGYNNGYGGGGNGYGPPPPAYGPPPPAYGPPPPAYGPPIYAPPRAVDTHYCSVHASFALALASQQQQGTPYGNNNNGPSRQPRRFTRQFCRYAAASTPESCNSCCTVAARAANTSPDEVFGAIFAFDPQNPTSNGAGYDDSQESGYGPYRKKRHAPAADARIPQCVCCAPKRPFL